MKRFVLTAALVLALPAMALAQQATPKSPQELGLSAPVIALISTLAKNTDALNLDETQRAELKAWLDVAPGKRMAVENETAELRTQMREAIIANAPVADRQALAEKVGANETLLIMMRSNCVDHWRGILSAEQFAQLLELSAPK